MRLNNLSFSKHSTVAPLKFRNGWVISTHFPRHTIIHPCWDLGLKLIHAKKGPRYESIHLAHDYHFHLIFRSVLFCLAVNQTVVSEELAIRHNGGSKAGDDPQSIVLNTLMHHHLWTDGDKSSQIARFVRPTWGPPGADRTQMGPMLAPWTLLSGVITNVFGSLLMIRTITAIKRNCRQVDTIFDITGIGGFTF